MGRDAPVGYPGDGINGLAAALGPLWGSAESGPPVAINIKAAPNVLVLPPYAILEQVKKLFIARSKGDGDRGAVMVQLCK